MRPRNCPKCGDEMAGPLYFKTTHGSERLKYRCACGFIDSTPTIDDQRKAEAAARQAEHLARRIAIKAKYRAP